MFAPEAEGNVVDPAYREHDDEDTESDSRQSEVGWLNAHERFHCFESPADKWPDEEGQGGAPEAHRDEGLALLDAPVLTHGCLLYHVICSLASPFTFALLS